MGRQKKPKQSKEADRGFDIPGDLAGNLNPDEHTIDTVIQQEEVDDKTTDSGAAAEGQEQNMSNDDNATDNATAAGLGDTAPPVAVGDPLRAAGGDAEIEDQQGNGEVNDGNILQPNPHAHPEFITAPLYDPNGNFSANCKPVTIASLLSASDDDSSSEEEGEGAEGPPITFLFVILLGLSVPKNEGAAVKYTSIRNNVKRGRMAAAYRRLYNLGSLFDTVTNHTCVVLETGNAQHSLLWHWDKSKANIRVGVRLVIQSPRVVGFLPTGAAIVETDQPFLLVTHPTINPTTLIGSTAKHSMRYFVLKDWPVDYSKAHMPVPWKTSCNADACDRLQFKNSSTVTCGCFGQNSKNDTSSRNCIMKFDLKFRDSAGSRIRINNFTSLQTSRVFFKNGNIVGDYDSLSLSNNKRAFHAKFRRAVRYINEHGGWTLVGWYIRGEVDDDGKDDADERQLSSNLNYNLSYMQPSTLNLAQLPDDCVFGQQDLNATACDAGDANADAVQYNI